MSVKRELYTLVKAAITAIPGVKTFGKFNNQFDTEEREHSFRKPAIFFELSEITWQPSCLNAFNSGQTQMQKSETITFTLHIAYWSLRDEEDKFLALLDLVELVYRAVTNIESVNINPIQRIMEEDDSDHTEPIVWRTTFSTMLTESGISDNSSAEDIDLSIVY